MQLRFRVRLLTKPTLGHPTPPHVHAFSLFPSDVRKIFLEKGGSQASPHPWPVIYRVPLRRAQCWEVSELLFRVTSWSGLHKGAQWMVSEDSCEKGSPEGYDGVGET